MSVIGYPHTGKQYHASYYITLTLGPHACLYLKQKVDWLGDIHIPGTLPLPIPALETLYASY